MPHTIELKAEPRELAGKKVKQLRRQGYVPGNVYGDGMESMPVQVEAKALETALRHATSTTLVDLTVGKSHLRRHVLVRNVQYELLKRIPTHVDFYAVRMDATIKASVPLVLRGESPAAHGADVILLHPVGAVNVEGKPGDLPEAIEVDVTGLTEVNQAIYARDLPLPRGTTLLDDPEELIVKVQQTKAAPEPEADAPAAEAGEETVGDGAAPTAEAGGDAPAGEGKAEE